MHGRFRVDATCGAVDSKYIVIYNISIPKHMVDIDASRRAALETSKRLLEEDFPTAEVYVSLTASYHLRNSETGATKYWSGSFWGKLNSGPAEITPFLRFVPETFVATTFRLSTNIEEVLSWGGLETDWKFESLEALVLNVNVKVNANDAVLTDRGLLDTRKSRSRKIFYLD